MVTHHLDCQKMATGGEAVDYANIACNFTVGVPIACKPRAGALFRIEQKDLKYLLEQPSCLKEKIGEDVKKLLEQKDCYVFVTTHSNVYEPMSATPNVGVSAPTAKEPLIGGKIFFGRSEMPIEEVLLCAVSCCGRNSIMKISSSDTFFTLKSHGSKCHIGYNFVVGFLEASVVKSKIESSKIESEFPPTLSLAQCKLPVISSGVQYTAHLNWCCGEQLNKQEVAIEWPQLRVEEEADLDNEIWSFIAKRSIAFPAGQAAQAGAPVVLWLARAGRAHTYPLGINVGGEIITFDSIFELLKGTYI